MRFSPPPAAPPAATHKRPPRYSPSNSLMPPPFLSRKAAGFFHPPDSAFSRDTLLPPGLPPPRRSALIDLKSLPYLRLGDSRIVAHEMDKIEFCCSDPLFLHGLHRELSNLTGDLCDLSSSLVHKVSSKYRFTFALPASRYLRILFLFHKITIS